MQDIVHSIKTILQRELEEDSCDDKYFTERETKVAEILQEAISGEDGYDYVATVKAFLCADEIKRRKILSYCMDFFDPTISIQQLAASGEQIQPHRFLQEDEVVKLYKFVKRHSEDKSFGETVYKVMDKHGMTPPDVYKNALLRRQDFSRATNPHVKNVTRQLAWQIIVGLHCSLDEADDVLFSSGFIRRNSRLDLTMEFFIRHENYDIMAINDVLAEFDIKPFSCYKPVRDNDNKK